MRWFKLFLFQLKSGFLLIVRGFIIMLAVVSAVSVLCLGIYKSSFAYNEQKLLNAAIVAEDDFEIMDFVTSMISDVKGVSEICSFTQMDKEEALTRCRQGQIDLVIYFPKDFYTKAVSMEETSAQIIIYGEPTKLEKKLCAQIMCAQDIVSVTEGAILSMYDGIKTYDIPVSKGQMETSIFMEALNNYINRDRLFDIRNISAFGSFTLTQFYTSSAIIVIMLLGSIPLFGMYGHGERQLEQLIYGNRRFFAFAGVCRVTAMSLAMGTVMSVIACLLTGQFTKRGIAGIWIIALSVSLWVHLIASIVGDGAHVRVVYIFASLLMLIAGGVVLPIVFLPEGIKELSTYVPTASWHIYLLNALYGKRNKGANIIFITDVFFATAGICVYIRGLKNHD